MTTWPEKFYHSSGDTPAMVDPTQLHRSVFAGLAGIVTVAYADAAQASAVAGLSLAYAQRHVAEARARAVSGVLRSDAGELAASARTAVNAVTHAYARENAAVLSAGVFAGSARNEAVMKLAAVLERDGRVAENEVKEVAASHAAALGAPAPDYNLSPAELRASRLIVSRVPGHELTKSNAALSRGGPESQPVRRALAGAEDQLRSRGASDLRRMGFRDAACFYVNGRRSVLDIRNAVEAEYEVTLPIEAVEAYFRLFERAGAMKISGQ